jgi:hypothetical protein
VTHHHQGFEIKKNGIGVTLSTVKVTHSGSYTEAITSLAVSPKNEVKFEFNYCASIYSDFDETFHSSTRTWPIIAIMRTDKI